MPSFDDMKDVIYTTIKDMSLVADQSIEYQYQNSPHPNKPYFSLVLTSFNKIAEDAFTDISDSGISSMVGNREFTLMILGFGDGIVEKTTQLRDLLETPAVHAQLKAGGVFPFNVDGTVQNISGLDDSENEERSSYDVLMRTDSVITDIPLGIIKIVNAEGTYEQAGKPDIVETIHVDST